MLGSFFTVLFKHNASPLPPCDPECTCAKEHQIAPNRLDLYLSSIEQDHPKFEQVILRGAGVFGQSLWKSSLYTAIAVDLGDYCS